MVRGLRSATPAIGSGGTISPAVAAVATTCTAGSAAALATASEETGEAMTGEAMTGEEEGQAAASGAAAVEGGADFKVMAKIWHSRQSADLIL